MAGEDGCRGGPLLCFRGMLWQYSMRTTEPQGSHLSKGSSTEQQ